MKWVLWQLSQPVERNGLGFDPAVARRLTIEQAIFYLRDEDETKAICAEENRRSKAALTGPEKVAALREEMLKRRLRYTGSAEI